MARLLPKDTSDFEVTISTHTIIRVILLVALTVVLFLAVRHALHTLTLIGVAVFLSLALNAPVRWLASHLPGRIRGSRSLATAISVVVILVALGAFLVAIVPPIASQTTSFIKSAPQLIRDTQNGTGPIGQFVERYNLQGQVQTLSDQLSTRLNDVSGSAISAAAKIGGSLFATLTVIVLTIMMLVEGPRWRMLIEQVLPSSNKAHTLKLGSEMNKVIQGYVNGQVLLAAIAAVLILPILIITHVSYPAALMVIVFVCGLIPMVGHTIGATIVTIVALFTSFGSAVVVLAYYILYQQIENYVVQPRIQANSTNMSPLLVFISVIIGVNFGGLLGGLVAIPVAGCARILVLDYLSRRQILPSKVVSRDDPTAPYKD